MHSITACKAISRATWSSVYSMTENPFLTKSELCVIICQLSANGCSCGLLPLYTHEDVKAIPQICKIGTKKWGQPRTKNTIEKDKSGI